MKNDRNRSPVDWYIASYLIRFIELEKEGNDDDERRFYAWENTIIVKATSLEAAYDKVLQVANDFTAPYKGGPKGVPVRWVFEGVTELLPVYEDLEDGSELMYRELNSTKLKNIKKLIRKKYEFFQ